MVRRIEKVEMVQRILLLSGADNGLTRRAALALRRAGRVVHVVIVAGSADMEAAVARGDFDLVICPFLKARIPESIYRKWTTVVIHPGPVGDRGAHSLDWAISEAAPVWGVTAMSAVEELDAGPVWATRTFVLPVARKSVVYNAAVADAAVECVLETADKAADPAFEPVDQASVKRRVADTAARPRMRQGDRGFDWSADPELILRRIRAADGSPGVLSMIMGCAVYLYDAHPGRAGGLDAGPGTVIGRRHHGVEVSCGSGGSIWIGHLRVELGEGWSCKAPAAAALALAGLSLNSVALDRGDAFSDISYERTGYIGTVTFEAYNGAMTADLCRRLVAAIDAAARQDTRVLVIRGRGGAVFSNGLHLGAIEISDDPAGAAWRNIKALNAVCRAILSATSQVTIGAFTGSAGAGGVMLPLAADVVVATDRALLDPHYATMGLGGSELHTYTLPRRVGAETAQRLLTEGGSIDTVEARAIGLIDQICPDDGFDRTLTDLAHHYAQPSRWRKTTDRKKERLARDLARKPLDAYEYEELGEMARNLFDDSGGFAAKRSAFMNKTARRNDDRARGIGRTVGLDTHGADVSSTQVTSTVANGSPTRGRQ
ncbi:enoyl-CoA hydratase-related protein [Nocardia sp. NBC_01499]|uniref:enoyl-CoA hydratase-related protein n=1 Tax=Nocardia sp. NBC_01499 TaxID=2903597 RepID=UPI00386AEEEB